MCLVSLLIRGARPYLARYICVVGAARFCRIILGLVT